MATAPAWAQPQVWAIVVGIDEYVRPSIPKLRYAVADAKLFSQALQDTLKVPQDHIFLMTSDAVDENSQPRFVNVAYRLSSLKGKVKKDDTVIFYFAGHGVTLDGEPFLLTEEADNRSALTLKASSLHGGDLITTLRKTESGNVWVMLDACRNSPNDKEDSKLDPAVSSALSQANVGLLQTATMFSCKVGERAWEWDEKKHGCYSYFLVEGLRRDAADSQGRVTLQSLADYVSREVPQVAKRFGSAQNPTMFYGGPTAGQWLLANVAGVAAAPPGKRDADISLHIARLEAAQARIDEESALRVKAEQRAKLAESQLREMKEQLALMETQISGKPRATEKTPGELQPQAYAEGPLNAQQSKSLKLEVERLREENAALKRRLAGLETEATKVGMAPREVALESQPLLSRMWDSATQTETLAEKGLDQPEDLRKSLQLCLSVRQALAQKITVINSCYGPTLQERRLSPKAKNLLAVMRERLEVQQLLRQVYESRLAAADAAIQESQDRLQEALAREQKYLAIIANLQGQLDAANLKIAELQLKLDKSSAALRHDQRILKELEYRVRRQKRSAYDRSPERRNFSQVLEHILDVTDLGVSQEATEEEFDANPPLKVP